jgi:hypothetical protein
MSLTKLEDCIRSYSSRGSVAHLVLGQTILGSSALCGQVGPIGDWLGTGDQNEYDKAAALMTCRRCRTRFKELYEKE